MNKGDRLYRHEIERLRAENAKLRAALNHVREWVGFDSELAKEITALTSLPLASYPDNEQLRAENASLGEALATLELDNHKLRAALLNIYNLFSKSNDFRSDSGPARDARAALNEETKLKDADRV